VTPPHDSSRSQFPLGWDGDELGWLATSAWLAASFPSFERRRAALVERVAEHFADDEHALRDASVALLDEVSRAPSHATTVALVALHDRMHMMPPSTSPGVGALHVVVAALASMHQPDAEPPIAAALRCSERTTIPPEHGELAVALTIALPHWYDAQMLGLVDVPVAPTNGLDDRDLSQLDREIEDYLEIPGEGFRREAGGDDDARGDTLQRRMLRHLARVAAALSVATGSTAPMWSPTATLADWLARRSGTGFSALGTITRRHDYFLRLMPLVDHRNPCTLPLYEAYADTCDRAHWEHVEHAALALAREASPRATATTLLRAATRRFFARDLAGCRAIAEQAFPALQAADDRDGARFAAGLLARTSAIDDPLAARAWLTTALALLDRDDLVPRLGVATELTAACEATGDELGRRRASDEVDRIRRSMEPERVADLVDGCSRPVDASVEHSYGSAGFDRVAQLLADSEVVDAYASFSEEIGDLVETIGLDDVVARLRHALELARAAALIALEDDHVPIAATIAGWLCAAIADLLVDPARDDEWEDARRLQFELEDEYMALPELLFGVEGDTDRFDGLVEGGASDAQLLLVYRSFCATAAVPRYLAEAERALADGRSRRARFWTERAAVLRQRT
jgi:hypothetical protein